MRPKAKVSPTRLDKISAVATVAHGILNSTEISTAVIVGSISVKSVRFRKDILDIEKTVTARSGITMNSPTMNAKLGKMGAGIASEMMLQTTNMTTHMIFVNSEKAKQRRK